MHLPHVRKARYSLSHRDPTRHDDRVDVADLTLVSDPSPTQVFQPEMQWNLSSAHSSIYLTQADHIVVSSSSYRWA